MRKPFCLFLALLVCLAAAACAEEAKAPETLLELVNCVAEDSMDLAVMSADDLYDMVGVAPEDYDDFAYLSDYGALSGRELIVVRAVDEEAADRVVEILSHYLELRMRETRNYLPDAYKALSVAEVLREDLLAVLSIAAPNPEEASMLLQEE